jgi:DNA-binding transcriptional regulator YdaS (Cro superfamily)
MQEVLVFSVGMRKNPIDKAIDSVGSLAELSRRTGLAYQSIQQFRKHGRLPAEHVLTFEAATNSAVTRYEFRPDIYPRPN